jgi:hypothetical protein
MPSWNELSCLPGEDEQVALPPGRGEESAPVGRDGDEIAEARTALALAAELAECTEAADLADRTLALGTLVVAEGVIVTAARDWMGETTIEVGDPGVYRAELLGRSAATGATMWPRLGQVMSEAPEYVA